MRPNPHRPGRDAADARNFDGAQCRLWGRALTDAVDGYRFLAGVGINAECLPSEGNRLELSDEVDVFGMPKAVVHFSAGANEQPIERHATQLMCQIVEAAGAARTVVLPRTAHTIGTCRMGTDRETAVVDAPWSD